MAKRACSRIPHPVAAAVLAAALCGSWTMHGAAQEQTASAAAAEESRATKVTAYGAVELGDLSEDDGRLQAGEARDLYTFAGRVGDPIVIELTSEDFTPYLAVVCPSGYVFRHDGDGGKSPARILLRLREDGEYQIVVTSFAPGERGTYSLKIMDQRVKIAP